MVRAKFAGVATPDTLAVTLYVPAVVLAVNVVAVATPAALVLAVTVVTPAVKVPLAPEAGAVNVTVAPTIGLLLASLTVADSAVANAAPTVAVCGVPPVAEIDAAVPAVFVRLNVVDRLAVDAVTVYEPAFELAVKAGAVATPDALVVAVAEVADPGNVPLAPLAGAVNVTVTP